MPTDDDFRRAGLWDPSVHGPERPALLRWLVERGFDIDDMIEAASIGDLTSLASERRIAAGPFHDRAEAERRSHRAAGDLDAAITALGITPIRGETEVKLSDDEITGLSSVLRLTDTFSREEALAVVRVIGTGLARIAEASVTLFLQDIESPLHQRGGDELELAKQSFAAAGLLDDGLMEGLDPILRRHVIQAAERARATTIDFVERFQHRYAVGFVDLVGFTTVSAAMSPQELARFIRRFEGRTHDIITGAGARVVKHIGDEVMFASTDPDAACRAASALMEAYENVGEGRVVPRGGLGYGNVLQLGGDYYGPVVNVASRLVDEAVPQELLVTSDVAEAAVGCSFEPAGRRMLKGFADPVAVASFVSG